MQKATNWTRDMGLTRHEKYFASLKKGIKVISAFVFFYDSFGPLFSPPTAAVVVVEVAAVVVRDA